MWRLANIRFRTDAVISHAANSTPLIQQLGLSPHLYAVDTQVYGFCFHLMWIVKCLHYFVEEDEVKLSTVNINS